MNFKVYIPARYESSRLPGKLLLKVGGCSILERVYRNACESGASQVVVATDHNAIAEVAGAFGAAVLMTDPAHGSGTDRIAEAAQLNGEPEEQLIVNVQGDEPLLPPRVIAQVAALLDADPGADIATLSEQCNEDDEHSDPNVCKVVCAKNGRALYFSRAPVPFCRDPQQQALLRSCMRRHIGIYAYRVQFLRRFVALPVSNLESIEKLEQLRALENGFNITVADAVEHCGFGIDTQADFERFRQLLAAG